MSNQVLRSIVSALVFALAPALALAEDPPAAAPAPAGAVPPAAAAPTVNLAAARPDWSFGAGVGFSPFMGGSIAYPVWAGFELPTVNTSLERRLSDRSWLALGVSGTFSRNRLDVPEGGSGVTRHDARVLLASIGVRCEVTRPRAPVQVSLLYVLQGGVFEDEVRFAGAPSMAPISPVDQTDWIAGAQVGIAVEREFTEGLSLRVASPLLDGHYSETNVRIEGQPSLTTSKVVVNAVLAPRLELRLLF